MVRVAANRRRPAFHIGVKRLGIADHAPGGEDHLGGFGGDLPPGIRGPGLHDHRPALHRPRHIQRPAHRKLRPLMVQHMHPGRVPENAALHIADEGVIGKTVP